MLLIAALTLVLVVAIMGLGAFFCRVLEHVLSADLGREAVFGEMGLLGIAGITIVGAALNWVIPLNGFVAGTIVTFGLAAAILFRSRIRDSFQYGMQTSTLIYFLAALLLHVSIKAYWNNFGSYDSGLYHLQTIMLESWSPLTLGAANLHYRFGYNSLWLSDAALLVLPGLGVKTSALINGVVTIFGVGAIFQRLCEDLRSRQPAMVTVFSVAILGFVAVPLGGDLNLGSPSTDWPSSLLTLCVYAIAFRLIAGARLADGRRKLDPFLMLVIAAIATAFKLSQAPVALALCITCFFVYREDRTVSRAIIAGAIVAGITIVLWILRGIGLSGCLLYPVVRTCLSTLPWTVPAHIANFDAASIQSWARVPWASPATVLANWDWLPMWWSRVSHGALIPLMAGFYLVSVICIVTRLVWRDSLRLQAETLNVSQRWAAFGLQASTIAGIAYWFFTAPDLRFGYSFLIAQPAMMFALMFPLRRTNESEVSSWPISLTACARAASLVMLLASVVEIFVFGRRTLFATDRPSVPSIQIVSHRSLSGFVYSTPTGSDQCWTSALYCTIEREDSLTFRHVGIWPMFSQHSGTR